jgi:hypothetical protein
MGPDGRESFGQQEIEFALRLLSRQIEKEKLRFVFDPAIRESEQQKIRSEMKVKDQEDYVEEALTKRAQFFA